MNTQRQQIIREMLQNQPFVSLKELEERFPDVSSMTLRRDIDQLEKLGEALKVRGGARSVKFLTAPGENRALSEMLDAELAREKIARQAVALIEPGRSIFLDGGAIMLSVAGALPNQQITAVTSGPAVAMELMKKSRPIINIVGGMLNRDTMTVSGIHAQEFLEGVNIDLALLAPDGVSLNDGLSCGDFSECALKKLVVSKAHHVVALLEASRLEKSLPYTFCTMEELDIIIADRELPNEFHQQAASAGVKIIIA